MCNVMSERIRRHKKRKVKCGFTGELIWSSTPSSDVHDGQETMVVWRRGVHRSDEMTPTGVGDMHFQILARFSREILLNL